jgi:hypothetical protein
MIAPFVIASHQISHEDITESPISTQEEYSDDEDQESEHHPRPFYRGRFRYMLLSMLKT